jgi:hypothetical protein
VLALSLPLSSEPPQALKIALPPIAVKAPINFLRFNISG